MFQFNCPEQRHSSGVRNGELETRDLIPEALLGLKHVQSFCLCFFYLLTVGSSFSFSFRSKDLLPESSILVEDNKTQKSMAK